MLDLAFRNIMRQRTRTFLTALGIVIGIGAIVALGSFAEGINEAVQSGLELTTGKIMVTEKNSGFFGMMGNLNDEDLETIMSVSGIKDVVPMLVYMENLVPMKGPEWQAIGIDPEKENYFVAESIKFDEGRKIYEGESYVAMIGNSISEKYDLHVGDFFTINGKDFEIVGVIEKLNIEDIDNAVIVPLKDLQSVLNKDTFQAVYVIPDDVRDTERISEDIEDANDKLNAMSSKDLARQASAIVDNIRIFTFGIGAIAAVVGGLGVMNTMIMAVLERRREIGVMKAIGATKNMILKQIIIESALISIIGGAGGLLLGFIASLILGSFGGGSITATVTPNLALISMGFALFLGLVGGFYPAKKAADLDPVVALRYE